MYKKFTLFFDLAQDLGMSRNVAQLATHEKRIKDLEYHRIVRSLNVKQCEFFIHVLHWMKTKEQPLYLFLTGGAGVGKSVVVRAFPYLVVCKRHYVE
jgi:pantothenate kinase-related protein Tda10